MAERQMEFFLVARALLQHLMLKLKLFVGSLQRALDDNE